MGINIANKTGKDTVKIGEKEIPFDMEELNKAMNDPEFSGKICDVHDQEKTNTLHYIPNSILNTND